MGINYSECTCRIGIGGCGYGAGIEKETIRRGTKITIEGCSHGDGNSLNDTIPHDRFIC